MGTKATFSLLGSAVLRAPPGRVGGGLLPWALRPHLGASGVLGPGFPLACICSESEPCLERTGSREGSGGRGGGMLVDVVEMPL